MSNSFIDEPMTEAYVYETTQIIDTLEQLMISSESVGIFSEENINAIFRFMHTIKGSSAMMMFNDISTLAHRMEDVFFVLRENEQVKYDFTLLVDVILESIDFFKIELMKIKEGERPDGDNTDILAKVSVYLESIKGCSTNNEKAVAKQTEKQNKVNQTVKETGVSTKYFKANLRFKKDADMENIRSFSVIHNMNELVEEVYYKPSDVMENDEASEEIRKNGFWIICKIKEEEERLKNYLKNTIFLDSLEFNEIESEEYKQLTTKFQDKISTENEWNKNKNSLKEKAKQIEKKAKHEVTMSSSQSIISVNVEKLDSLMDMVGELVIAEAMVTQNPEILSLELESFEKASRQLHKITGEMQDLVMAIRMVPLSTTFMKMHRIVRDMNRKLGKNVALDVLGEETEVDKNIIEKIADPLMHIIRNCVDHGIESEDERKLAGKDTQGTVVLEAKNSGSDVLIIVRDDGKGLNKRELYNKAASQGLLNRPFEDMSDREINNLILKAGFSTKEEVTEFSGRGVGMDVVSKNIESIGGNVIVESEYGFGTTIILKIPLTLAIIEGMNIKVGEARFTLPIVAIKESFRAKEMDIIKDTEGQEMIMVRGLCYPIIRLSEFYKIPTQVNTYDEGILIMVEENERSCCIFADELLGQQQVVVKTLPDFIKRYKQIKGLGGCTLLGDGSISLILSIGEFDLSSVKEKYNNKEVKP
ncbi:two-component system chemotaxis sensor kinase CheA [Lachnotalea glycerini]|uniref:Chemotaxis protein CheA n=1 Tax=Lachnotalea glycerini TaxID=1763509 RepID=A0A318ESK1_9FIRM|nr:chemotaxis protein CheA [Lachnotalea glycerini]PXV95480.1 two-component system chemotaxis sensor kinase CheA [Lachnotalea glycerini]